MQATSTGSALVRLGALAAIVASGCHRHSTDAVQGDSMSSSRTDTTDAMTPPPPDSRDARSIIDAAYTTVTREQRGIFYGLAISPAYPIEWPPPASEGPTFRTYGFAYGMDVQHMVADGQHTSSAWIIVTTPPKGALLIERAPFVDIGIQGVSPVVAGTIATNAERDQAVLELSARPDKPSALVQKVYCPFGKYNGVFVQTIAKRHASFLAWLACP